MMSMVEMGGNPVDEEKPAEQVEQGTTGASEVLAEEFEEKAPKPKRKRAAKKKAAKVEEKVSTAWNLGQRMTLHGCRVGKQTYRSFWQAWQAMNIGGSRGRHIKARGILKDQLKKTGNPSMVIQRPSDGKKFTFTLVESTPEE